MMENQETKAGASELDIETIAKSVPIIVGLFVLCGSLYLATYYDCFHINIFNYLDVSEILMAFLILVREIIFIISFFLAYIFIVKLIIFCGKLMGSKKKVDDESASSSITDKKSRFKKITSFTWQNLSIIITSASIAICIGYIIKAYSIEVNSKYILKNRDWMRDILIYFGMLSSLYMAYQFEAKKKDAIRNTAIFLSLFLISYSVCRAVERIESTVHEVDLNSMVVLENDTIKTDKNYIYVGRTNKYVFFFDLKLEKVDVVPQEGINKISFSFQRP